LLLQPSCDKFVPMGIIRKTKSVKKILDEFQIESKALSTLDLINRFQAEFNKTTIYRVLDKLEDDGVLHSFQGNNGVKWYAKCEACTEHKHSDIHPHFQCISCGQTDCLDVSVPIPTIPNREVSFSQFLLQGRCEKCLV